MLSNLPFVLHVLSLPLAFILSQDQTLHCNNSYSLRAFALQADNRYPIIKPESSTIKPNRVYPFNVSDTYLSALFIFFSQSLLQFLFLTPVPKPSPVYSQAPLIKNLQSLRKSAINSHSFKERCQSVEFLQKIARGFHQKTRLILLKKRLY